MVYRARQEHLDRAVVVKVLSAVDAEATRRRFDRERRAMGRLSQVPGIAPLYDSGFTGSDKPWLLMPHYGRGSLQDVVDAEGPLPPEQVRDIGVRVARAIQAAHDGGVLHRDLKPANILMSQAGQPDVADFGIAHLLDDTLGLSQSLTMTPLYTAPEVFDGVDAGASADVYSLGATLFALLNGTPAFDSTNGEPILAVIRRVAEDPLPPLPPHVPQRLAEVIDQAMAKDPADRFGSAGAMADALAAIDLAAQTTELAAGDANRKRRPGSGRSGGGRRTRTVAIGAALGLAALAAIIVAAVVVAQRPSPGVDDRDDDREAIDAELVVEATEVPTALPDPTAVPTGAAVFDLAAARSATAEATVRVEGFSCTGVEVAAGVVLADGRVLTEAAILRSPWWVDVSDSEATVHAEPLTFDLNRSVALVGLPPSAGFGRAEHGVPEPGAQVLIGGVEGESRATLAESEGPPVRLVAEVVDAAARPAPGSGVFDGQGDLVGVTTGGQGAIGVVAIDRFEQGWNQTPPRLGCPTTARDIGPAEAAAIESPHIRELLTLQDLNNAYADEMWDLVREIEPGKASMTDEQFVDGWRPLRQGFIYPVHRSVDADGAVVWRIGLIGHETWSGVDLTTLFCVSWQVDVDRNRVVQTNRDTVRVFGSQPGQPHQGGFVDPGDLVDAIDANCPVGP